MVLKPFFWDKSVVASGTHTIWGQLGMIGGQIELNDLEEVFSLEQTTPKSPSVTQAPKNKKQQVTTMLDITRANNVGE